MIKYLQSKISIAFRSRMVEHIHNMCVYVLCVSGMGAISDLAACTQVSGRQHILQRGELGFSR